MKIENQWAGNTWIYYRDWMLIEGVEWVKKPYVRLFKIRKKAWGMSNTDLLAQPAGSLGNALGRFLATNEIQLMDKLEDHDIMHVLLGLDTSIEDEAIMQYILIGNGKRSLFCLGTAALSWILMPALRPRLKAAFVRGKNMRKFYHWSFQFLLREPLFLIRTMITKEFGELEAPILW